LVCTSRRNALFLWRPIWPPISTLFTYTTLFRSLYANVAGGDIREIEVEAHPDDLLAAGLSAADLADEIGKVHRLQPVGRTEGQPDRKSTRLNSSHQIISYAVFSLTKKRTRIKRT